MHLSSWNLSKLNVYTATKWVLVPQNLYPPSQYFDINICCSILSFFYKMYFFLFLFDVYSKVLFSSKRFMEWRRPLHIPDKGWFKKQYSAKIIFGFTPLSTLSWNEDLFISIDNYWKVFIFWWWRSGSHFDAINKSKAKIINKMIKSKDRKKDIAIFECVINRHNIDFSIVL